MIKRVIFAVVALLGAASCYNDTAYDTTYVLRVYEQAESSGDYVALAGTKAYAFSGSTDDWEVQSFEDALAGVATSVESGEQKGPFAWSEPYEQSESNISLQLDRETVMLLIVDPASQIYAYSDYTVPQNFPLALVDIIIRPWKTASYTASTWTFIVPEVEEEETEEEETEEEEEETEEESTDTEDETTEDEDTDTEDESTDTDEDVDDTDVDTDVDTDTTEDEVQE